LWVIPVFFRTVFLDIGSGGGKHGGEIVAQGTPAEIAKVKKYLTGKWLA
jgi:excinuclease ABC subunit A